MKDEIIKYMLEKGLLYHSDSIKETISYIKKEFFLVKK